MSLIKSINGELQGLLESRAADLRVAGAVVGVSVGEQQTVIAYGCANLNTGQPFTPDTAFLLGSVTKILTATALLRLVERGEVDLDATVTRYVPEFTLRDAEAAERITVRMLLNHTNGIDASLLSPDEVRGRDASKSYSEYLARRDILFEPGRWLSYSNPGLVLAGRIVEERTGLPFERAIERELLRPCGMLETTAVQTQAFLRRTAIGAYADAWTATGRAEVGMIEAKATQVFTLPESGAAAGFTPIGTVTDLITFGRMHLNGGAAPNGRRLLSREMVTVMQTPSFDTGLPHLPPVGLGWWLTRMADTAVPWHEGSSPGGASSFCIIPEHDAVIASFVAGVPTTLNRLIQETVIEVLTGRTVSPPLLNAAPTEPADGVVGEYATAEIRVGVECEDDGLAVTTRFELNDEECPARVLTGIGFELKPRTVLYANVAPRLFAPAGADSSALAAGHAVYLAAVSSAPGRRAGLQAGLSYWPKVA